MSEKQRAMHDGFDRQNHAAGLEFHAGMSRAHKTAMDFYDEGSTERTFHEAAMQTHVAAGEYCSRSLASLKAAGADPDFAKGGLEPTGVSAIAIPRHGAPPVGGSADVPEMFRKMIFVGDE